MRKTISVLALLALVPAALEAQRPEERIEAAMARSQQAGIPVALLQSKIDEGRAKGVSMDRIAVAVERRAAGLARGQAAMGGARSGASAADLNAAADALESGVSVVVLQTISETAPRERRAVAIATLTELVAQGHAPQHALDRVTEALQRGPDALANLPAQAVDARVRRGPPEGVGSRRPSGVGAQGGAGGGPGMGSRPGSAAPAGVPAGRPAGAGRPGGI